MFVTNDDLTVWELAHRLANKRPNIFSSIVIPSDVKDNLRLLINEILHWHLDSTLSMEKWVPDPDDPDPDEPRFYIRYHLDDIYKCIYDERYKRSLMKFVIIDKTSFEDWCIKSGYPLPDFWYSIDYQYDESDMEPPSTDTKSAQKSGYQGGKKRAEKYETLQKIVYELYDSKYLTRSNRDAARRIIKDLLPSDLQVLSSDTPENTIAIWIGKYKKSKK